jgi:hypothetical protein
MIETILFFKVNESYMISVIHRIIAFGASICQQDCLQSEIQLQNIN